MTHHPFAIRRGWRSRFGAAVLMVFALHVGLVFWLGNRPAPKGAASGKAGFRVTPAPVDPLLIEEPTLFVLPHPRAVSGDVWIREPSYEFRAPARSDPLERWLPLPREQLGAFFVDYVRSQMGGGFEPVVMDRPALVQPPRSDFVLRPMPSTLRIGGDLVSRRVARVPELPLLQQADPPTNTVVDVWVDERGHVFTAVPRGAGTGSSGGETNALRLARQIRFEALEAQPDSAESRSLTWGVLIFEWQAAPATNRPALNPAS